VSEAAGFAAWLHGDMHDVGTARIYYRLAIDRARRAGQGLLAGYKLGSLAAFEIEGADPGLALPLVAQAREQAVAAVSCPAQCPYGRGGPLRGGCAAGVWSCVTRGPGCAANFASFMTLVL